MCIYVYIYTYVNPQFVLCKPTIHNKRPRGKFPVQDKMQEYDKDANFRNVFLLLS